MRINSNVHNELHNNKNSREEGNRSRFRSNSSATNFQDLAQDIIIEILSRLPVKSLLRFKAISKQWESLISDNKFVLFNHRGQREKLLFFLKSEKGALHGNLVKSYCSINHQLIAEEYPNPFPGLVYLGSCNGLLLFGDSQNINLWNPATNYCKVVLHLHNLGQLYYVMVAAEIFYDESVEDYQLVLLTQDYRKHDTIFASFSYLKSKTWTKNEINFSSEIVFRSDFGTPVVNGNLHIVAQEKKEGYNVEDLHMMILYFDRKKDEFGALSKPNSKHPRQNLIYGLGVIEGCLCMVRPEAYMDYKEVLMMKDYGVKESWTVMFTILGSNFDNPRNYSLMPVFLTQNGEVIMVENHSKVMAYNCKNKSVYVDDIELPSSIQKLLESCKMVGFTYVESLADGNQARPLRRKTNNKLVNFVYF